MSLGQVVFRVICRILSLLIRFVLVGMLVSMAVFAGFIAMKGSQPVGVVGADSDIQAAGISNMNYWQFMANRLAASSQTPANCHRTRLFFLAVALPVYPALYTYVALYPESYLARHVQPSPLIPDKIGWRDIPDAWWKLVKEVSWLAFTQPLWDFTPVVGQRVGVDKICALPEI